MKNITISKFLTTFLVVLSCQTAFCDYISYHEAIQAGIDEMQASNFEESQVAFDAALKLSKSDQQKAEVYSSLGTSLILQSKFAQARVQLKKVADLEFVEISTKALSSSRIGDTFMLEKNYKEARREYGEALKIAGTSPSLVFITQLSLSQTYLFEKKFDLARIELSKILLLKKSLPYVEIVLFLRDGQSNVAENNFDEARKNFSKALDFRSEDTSSQVQSVIRANQQSSQIGFAETYFLQKDYARAQEEYIKALAMEKLDYIRKKQIEKQLEEISKITQKQSKQETVK